MQGKSRYISSTGFARSAIPPPKFQMENNCRLASAFPFAALHGIGCKTREIAGLWHVLQNPFLPFSSLARDSFVRIGAPLDDDSCIASGIRVSSRWTSLRILVIVPLVPPAESNTTQIYLQATPPRSRTRAHSLPRLEIYLTRII